MTVGEKILNMRRARGWSQEELAARVSVTRQTVSRWESRQAKPDADKIIVLCDQFGVSADYLLRENYEGEYVQMGKQYSALGRALRAMSITESICGIVSLCGIVLAIVMTIVESSNNYDTTTATGNLLGIGIFCIFIWPAYRFLKWSQP